MLLLRLRLHTRRTVPKRLCIGKRRLQLRHLLWRRLLHPSHALKGLGLGWAQLRQLRRLLRHLLRRLLCRLAIARRHHAAAP
jgi:hypothetical protein